MGGGRYSGQDYSTRAATKRAAGQSTFHHTDQIRRGEIAAGCHDTLDPKATNNNGPHTGEIVREAYDNPDHPLSVPIAVFFDVTGSNYQNAEVLQQKMVGLRTLLDDKGYCPDAQLLFGAIGDARTDAAPLQVSQFESDNASDAHLENIYLEGRGGGHGSETYELALYFMAHLTDTDHWNKRGEKGHIYLIADENPAGIVDKEWVERFIGEEIDESIDADVVVKDVLEKWNLTILLTGNWQGYGSKEAWEKLVGAENVFVLESADNVAETIALQVGLAEGTTTPEQFAQDLQHAQEAQAEATASI